MRRRLLPLAFVFALFTTLAGQQPAQAQQRPFAGFDEPGGYRLTFVVAGRERSINVWVPEGYDPDGEPVPLLLALHGAGGNGPELADITGFNDLATEQNFVVVYPDGVSGGWNDARPDTPMRVIDDVRFLDLTIDFIRDEMRIDPDRVYAAGYSMGGMMSFRLGCQLGDKIAAVASVASTFPAYLLDACLFADPIPVLVIQGTDDTIIPADGYRDSVGNRVMLSTDETMRYWSELNGCASGTRIQFLPDADPADGTRVRREFYDGCEDNASAELLLVRGGGHAWPGHPFTDAPAIGVTTMDLDATAEIWRFFEAHPRGG